MGQGEGGGAGEEKRRRLVGRQGPRQGRGLVPGACADPLPDSDTRIYPIPPPGVDLIRDNYDWLMGQGAQLVMLGSGREDLENALRCVGALLGVLYI